MAWSLNIAANGQHFAKVEFPEYLTKDQTVARAFEFIKRFNDADTKWEMSLTHWQTVGKVINLKGDDTNENKS
jgi:hypothetical protein